VPRLPRALAGRRRLPDPVEVARSRLDRRPSDGKESS
jgi:hypothetical protein